MTILTKMTILKGMKRNLNEEKDSLKFYCKWNKFTFKNHRQNSQHKKVAEPKYQPHNSISISKVQAEFEKTTKNTEKILN